MNCYSICAPERLGRNPSTYDIVVDIENNKISFSSASVKDAISLDLICAAELEEILRNVVNSKPFQTALSKKVSEHLSCTNAQNLSAL